MEGERNKTVTARASHVFDKRNVCYDSLLKKKFPGDSVLVGNAGDAATLRWLNRLMRTISTWMSGHGVSLALNNAENAVLTKKGIQTIFHIRVGKEIIEL